MPDADAARDWRQVRIYDQLARAHNAWSGVSGGPRYALLDELLPALIYINAVAVLDDALKRLLGPMPKGQDNLSCRLKALRDRGSLLDYGALDAVRLRRNEFAHQGRLSIWAELDAAFATMEREMINLEILDRARSYTHSVERGKARDAGNPKYIWAQDFSVIVLEDGQEVGKHGTVVLVERSEPS